MPHVLRRCLLFLMPALLAAPAWPAEPHSLRLVSDAWPPYEIATQDSIDGFSVAVCDAVLSEMGIQLLRPSTVYPWARAMAMTENGQADVLVSGLWAAERNQWGLYPKEGLLQTRYAVFARLGAPHPKSPTDVHEGKLGVVHRFHYTDGFVESLPASVTVVSAFTPQANLENLARGQVDLVIEDQYTAQFIIRQQHWQDRIDVEPAFKLSNSPLYAIFSRKTVTPALVEAFSRRLGEYKQTQAYRDLATRYGIAP